MAYWLFLSDPTYAYPLVSAGHQMLELAVIDQLCPLPLVVC